MMCKLVARPTAFRQQWPLTRNLKYIFAYYAVLQWHSAGLYHPLFHHNLCAIIIVNKSFAGNINYADHVVEIIR
jgi:hypothetical protein